MFPAFMHSAHVDNQIHLSVVLVWEQMAVERTQACLHSAVNIEVFAKPYLESRTQTTHESDLTLGISFPFQTLTSPNIESEGHKVYI